MSSSSSCISSEADAARRLDGVPWSNGWRAVKTGECKRGLSIDLELAAGGSSTSEVTNAPFVAFLLRGENVKVVVDGRSIPFKRECHLLVPAHACYMFVNEGSESACITCVVGKQEY